MQTILLKIAYRNLREHKTKTLIIGILIMLGISILVIGNSFLETANRGIENTYINNYTGNIIITSSEMEAPLLTMPMRSGNLDAATPIIPEFQKLKDYVQAIPGVAGTAEQIDGIATLQWGEFGEGVSTLFGVDPVNYPSLFPSGINIVSGTFLSEDEEGIVLSSETADSLSKSANAEIKVGDTVLVTGRNGTSGTKIRELTVRGIHEPLQSSPEMAMVSYVDPVNMRILNGIMLLSAADSEQITEELILSSENEEDLFSGEGTDLFTEVMPQQNILPVDTWDSILGDTLERNTFLETDPDGWHFMMVKLEDGVNGDKVLEDLNQYFEASGIDAKAWGWLDGAGMTAQMAVGLQIMFNILILIVAVVAVIVIVNALVISVSERIGEIGTMRAIGARKGFVRMMITWETIIISLFFGLLGILLGAVTIWILGIFGISAGSNPFLLVLLGGESFYPALSTAAMGQSLLVITVMGVLASLYPVSLALKISPVRAMTEN